MVGGLEVVHANVVAPSFVLFIGHRLIVPVVHLFVGGFGRFSGHCGMLGLEEEFVMQLSGHVSSFSYFEI
jgi:hypothetical protein